MFGTDEAFCRCKEHQLPTTAGSDLTGHGEVHICVDDQVPRDARRSHRGSRSDGAG